MSIDRRAFLLAMAGLATARAPLVSAESPAEQPVEFAPVLPGRTLVFPEDHGAHPAFRTEWWYATGWLALPDGSPVGFQTTFFRVRTGIGERNPSAFAPRQLMLAHAAVADPRLGQLRHDQRAARVALGVAGFETGRTSAWIGDWRFEQLEDRYRALVRADEFAYNLTLTPDGPPMRNGAAGFSAKAPDPRQASYYYSRPQLAVSGKLDIEGREQPVTGRAWLDHEWSSQYLPAGASGWDWVGLDLDDGGALMAFRMRDTSGGALWSAATLRTGAGDAHALGPESVEFVPGRRWRSPRTGIEYPVEWQLRIGERRLELKPLMDDQELDSSPSTGAIYWEGAVRVAENGREIGRGYLEMTGYGEKIRVG